MKFKDIRDNYYTVTGKASDVARQLAFVGFAAIWVFRQGSSGIVIPPFMFMAAVAFGLALFSDMLQYGIASRDWRKHVDRADVECEGDEDECEVPVDTNDLPRICFTVKVWLVGGGYLFYVAGLLQIVAS